jgi:hypothetical protein
VSIQSKISPNNERCSRRKKDSCQFLGFIQQKLLAARMRDQPGIFSRQ